MQGGADSYLGRFTVYDRSGGCRATQEHEIARAAVMARITGANHELVLSASRFSEF